MDISASALTESWSALFVGLIESERLGRVARVGLSELINSMFIQGSAASSQA